jgi:hypothetical protein
MRPWLTKIILAVLLVAPLGAQVTVPTLEDLLVAGNGAQTQLNGAISASATSIVVVDASTFPALGANQATVILINGMEMVKVCAESGNTFTVCTSGRGFDGTTAQAHSNRSRVITPVAAAFHNNLASELIEGMLAIQALEVVGGTSINVEENNVEVISAANLTGIDFLGADFDVTADVNEANVAIAPAITRDAEVPGLEVNNLSTVTWVNVPDANITVGSVTQHVASINHDALLNFSLTKHIDHAASATSAFIQDGGVTSLTCGVSNQGRMQILDDGTLQVCDGATTSALRAFVSGAHTVEANNLNTVTWANVPDANITEGSVTQHEAALTVTEAQISDLQAYITAADNAATATALAANPADCAANQFAYTIAANGDLTCSALTDADIPNTITIDLATTATTANAGDSATAFFSAGTIEHERGGLEADVSAYSGLLKISAGVTSQAASGTDYVVPAGNVATATALAVNGANCGAGNYPLGVDASGAVESCTAVGAGSTINVEENNVEVISSANLTGIDFLGADFDVTADVNEADIAIAAAITRDAEVPGLETNNLSTVTWVNVPNANITAGAVTQHQAALSVATTQLTGSVTDAQVPNTITIDLATLATTATTANAGDSATAFFSVGLLEDAIIAASITRDTEWDTLAEINAATTDDDAAGLAATNAFTGTPTFSNATYSALFTGGNVGIGTTAPTSQLQVRGTGQSVAAVTDAGLQGGTLLLSDSGTAANNGGALLMGGQVTNGSKSQVGIKALLTDSTANGLSDMAFLSRAGSSDTALTEYMRITSTGNVGIGTATPGAALQVVSTTSADQLRVGYDTTNYYKIGRNTANGVLHFQGTQATYNGYNFLSQAGTSSFFIKDSGSVGIGTAAPNASAILDLTSTTRALLIPRMTTTQRDALTAVNGMLIYNSTLNKFQGYEGGAWASLI